MNRRHVSLYADGSCVPNPGIGGYAAIIRDGRNQKEVIGRIAHCTNNRAELTAVIEGLARVEPNSLVTVFTDSGYVERAMNEGRLNIWRTNGWRRIKTGEPVQNADLWRTLSETIDARNLSLKVRKLPGHSGHPLNERADYLARRAAKTA